MQGSVGRIINTDIKYVHNQDILDACNSFKCWNKMSTR